MCWLILIIKLMLVQYVSLSKAQTESNCNDDVSLDCPVGENNQNFISVAWYKLINGAKYGIIRRGKDEEPVYYNNSRTVTFGERQNLLLFKVSPADSGTYECTISAFVGHQNQNHKVDLIVHECVTTAEPTPAKNVLNTTQMSTLCQPQVRDLPVTWSVAGYVAVALAKIALSLIIIGVIHVRSSKQQYNRWHN